ncbi:MAG: di-trans,poly-cis-decaprenylcistransferase [Candidatus Hydrogenedentes bacterium]|nr:di-trans,poly-cis-decaprenylcistransferase [Candidatus Hydrogenedentota bacterium]
MDANFPAASPLHVAVIMDGNGRWAAARNLPRSLGHREGVKAVRRIVECAPDLGVGVLTLFAFSVDNWRRPRHEVGVIMELMAEYLRSETDRCVEEGVRVTVLGCTQGIAPALQAAVREAQARTAHGKTLWLRVAFNYSSRDAILSAAARFRRDRDRSRAAFSRLLAQNGEHIAPDVDLLIRTGGEKRLSDFLLWEAAYAELHFTDVMWPEFGAEDLKCALNDFRGRERRFGTVGRAAVGANEAVPAGALAWLE